MPSPTPGSWSGQVNGWRYLAQRIDGSGTPGLWLDNELPLTGVSISDVLSGPPQLKATISPVYGRLIGSDGLPLLHEWGTVIYAECDGTIRAAGILADSSFQGPDWGVECSGFCGYVKNMDYPSDEAFTGVETLDIVRHAWAVIQAENGSNLALQVDQNTVTGITQGTVVSTDSNGAQVGGPYTLNWYSTTDVGGEIDKLASATPFEYHERHQWSTDRSTVDHFLDFGFPSVGRRLTGLRFIYGENIQTIPQPTNNGTDFANHVVILGAGEGSTMVRAESRLSDGRLRRMVTLDDKSITSSNEAAYAASLEVARRQQLTQLSSVAIRNTPMAPIGSFRVGDEIRVQATTDWMPIDLWARIIQLDITPDLPDMVVAHLIRSDWVTGGDSTQSFTSPVITSSDPVPDPLAPTGGFGSESFGTAPFGQ